MNKVNPEMITVAREARGITQSQLAERMGIQQATVSKYESGLLGISDEHLVLVVKELDFPESFFLQTDSVFGFGSACFYHRKRTRMPVGDLRQLQARLNIFRFHVTRLIRGVEIETQNSFLRLDVDEHGGPEEVARAVRHSWNLPMGPVMNVVNAVESAGAIVYALPMGTRAIDAISQVVPGAPPVIFINAEIPGDRLRFTLMHEVGHIIMHQVPSDDMELQADKFAAEFLMPQREIASSLKNLKLTVLPALKAQWKVSMAAVIRRSFDLGCSTERQYRYLNTQMSMNGWKINEPMPIPQECPTVFANILDAYITKMKYTTTELAHIVNAKESRFAAYLGPRVTESGGLRVVG